MRHDQEQHLRAALDTLPPRERDVMLLKYWGELPQTEIAPFVRRLLGLP